MENLYRDSMRKYRMLISTLINENTAKISSEFVQNSTIKCSRDKAIIPFIPSSPKSNFITITPVNFFTKDDPILRYVPTVRTAQPSSIIWFEGTVFGTKSFDKTDMIDLIFLRELEKSNNGKMAVEFVKNTFGRNLEDLCVKKSNKKLKMKDLFCSVCLLFGCQIHPSHNPKILKFDEKIEDEKAATSNIKNNKKDKDTTSNVYNTTINTINDTINNTNDTIKMGCESKVTFVGEKRLKTNELAVKIFENLSLKACVLRKMAQLMNIADFDCKMIKPQRIAIKKVSSSGSSVDPRQFYIPCDHSGACKTNKCPCFLNGTLCESFCGCSDCKNLIFCNCKNCGKSCPCLLSGRECTNLCHTKDEQTKESILKPTLSTGKSDHNKLMLDKPTLSSTDKKCCNSPIISGVTRKVSICKSLKHGLGLFSEEFIPANEFVIEYTGELISDKEAERRGNFYEMNKLSYLFNSSMAGNDCLHSIDAFFVGNKSRFINHSVSGANLKSKILVSHGNVKIVFYSIKDIYKGDEFLFDYQFTEEHKMKHGIVD